MVLRRLELRCVALKSLSHAARMKLAVTHGLTRDWIKVRIPYAHDQIRHFFHALAGTIDYSIDSLCKRLKFGRLQSQDEERARPVQLYLESPPRPAYPVLEVGPGQGEGERSNV